MAVSMGFRVAWLAKEALAGAPHAIHAVCAGATGCARGARAPQAQHRG